MLERVRFILQHNCLVNPSTPLVVGVSGGPDSLCLLDILVRLGYNVVVAHFNHQLRSESSEEARRVETLAARLGTTYAGGGQDVGQYAAGRGLSVEEAARELRYRYLFAQAERYQAQAVAVGHTADDQVETVLMHLLRGAATDGLSGMAYRSLPNPWSREISLVRPLLAVWREEILPYIADQGLQPSIDASNLDPSFFRNRLRHEIIPGLERYQPRLRGLLWRTADVIAEERRVLESLVEAAWDECIREQGPGYLALDGESMQAQPLGVQRRVLRRAIATFHAGLRDVDYETVERGLAFITSPRGKGQCSLVAGLFLLKEGAHIWLAVWQADLPKASWPQLEDQDSQALSLPGIILLPDGWELQALETIEAANLSGEISSNTDPFQAWFDAEALPANLLVRRRQPGDRIQPLGMEGHSLKISDLLVNLKIPRRARADWPLVCAGADIIWVPGCRQADFARVTGTTRRVARLVLVKTGRQPSSDPQIRR
jgi:tRNA(Ile)-lysidine synthase